ncbi:diguanylate cyclase domain-containing protein [Enterocloster clostridioformis]|uniref:diguanylate cyclase domain-containing protein n=1 Tax=Enterocloster clostridioformis TaxID=1531 RepID=UPI003A7F5748
MNKFGYSFGDNVLYRFSRKLKLLCGPDRCVYRLEGDEFIIQSPGGSRKDTESLFEEIIRQLEYSGDIHVVGRFIVDQVFQKARKWQPTPYCC